MTEKRVNHALHALLTLATGGGWAIVWALVALDAATYNADVRRLKRRKK